MRIFKLFYKILFAIGFGLMVLPVSSQNIEGKKVVIIDPGHGGRDSGAIGINGVLEKDIVLSIARAMVKLNARNKSKFEIYLTRYKDTLISLSDRTRIAKTLKADLFISLHCNQSENPKARGVEVYVNARGGNFFRESVFLAYALQKQIKTKLGFESRGVKIGDFQVLRETINYCPAFLVELGFLSNWDEIKYLTTSERKSVLAILILKSISAMTF